MCLAAGPRGLGLVEAHWWVGTCPRLAGCEDQWSLLRLVLAPYWVGKPPSASMLENFKKVLASTVSSW